MTQWPNIEWNGGHKWKHDKNGGLSNRKKNEDEVKWEMIKSHEYSGDELQSVTNLYSIIVNTETQQHHFSSIPMNNMNINDELLGYFRYGKPEEKRMLVKISVHKDCALLNKAVKMEILEEVIPYKFTSSKRNNIKKICDLHKHLSEISQEQLGNGLRDRMIDEYQKSVKLIQDGGS